MFREVLQIENQNDGSATACYLDGVIRPVVQRSIANAERDREFGGCVGTNTVDHC
jgi:hypothetical protein